MNTHTDKTHDNKRKAVAKEFSQKQRGDASTFQFVDNRAEAIAQRKLQEMANNSPQAKEPAPLQAMINNTSLMVVQRQQVERMFGEATQRQEVPEEEELQVKADAAPVQRQDLEDEAPLQGKFESVQRQEGMEEDEIQMKAVPATLQRQPEPEEEELIQGKFAPVQRQGDEELLQGTMEPVKRQEELEEEDLLQGQFDPVQPKALGDEDLLQGRFASSETPTQLQGLEDGVENRTGMPAPLQAGLEQLSSLDLSGVHVHYNSARQGQDIEVGPGQEQQLSHEGWHTVQQMQGRVKPTKQAQGVSINDDEGLEREADVMGAKALKMRRANQVASGPIAQATIAEPREREQTEASEVPSTTIGASGDKVRLNFLATGARGPTQAIQLLIKSESLRVWDRGHMMSKTYPKILGYIDDYHKQLEGASASDIMENEKGRNLSGFLYQIDLLAKGKEKSHPILTPLRKDIEWERDAISKWMKYVTREKDEYKQIPNIPLKVAIDSFREDGGMAFRLYDQAKSKKGMQASKWILRAEGVAQVVWGSLLTATGAGEMVTIALAPVGLMSIIGGIGQMVVGLLKEARSMDFFGKETKSNIKLAEVAIALGTGIGGLIASITSTAVEAVKKIVMKSIGIIIQMIKGLRTVMMKNPKTAAMVVAIEGMLGTLTAVFSKISEGWAGVIRAIVAKVFLIIKQFRGVAMAAEAPDKK